MMTQYDAHRRYVRSAAYNATLYQIWTKQVPYGTIVVK